MDLTPQALFGIVVGAPLVLIAGMGLTLAIAVYVLDRTVRNARNDEQEEVQTPARAESTSPAMAAVAAAPTPSALSQTIMSGGVIEADNSMGVPHSKLGMWTFLASEVMFFTALIGAYIAFRVSGRFEMEAVREALNVPLATLNTFILIVSSFTVVMALDAVQENKQNRFVLFLLATMILGGTFISFQGVEWSELLSHGITPADNLYGTAFFVLTGFHGLHVIVGLLWLVFALLRSFRGDFNHQQNLGIETFGLYWHFVDIVWIILFTMIYLIE